MTQAKTRSTHTIEPWQEELLREKEYSLGLITSITSKYNHVGDRCVLNEYRAIITLELWPEWEVEPLDLEIGEIVAYKSHRNFDLDALALWADHFSDSVCAAFSWLSSDPEFYPDDVDSVTYISAVVLDPKWRGYDLGLKALVTFLDVLDCSFVFFMPAPIGHASEEEPDPRKVKLLKRYWSKLGFPEYDEENNYVWTELWTPPERFWPTSDEISGDGRLGQLHEYEDEDEDEETPIEAIEALCDEAERKLSLGLHAEAVAACEQVIAADPTLSEPYLFLSRTHFLSGHLEDAIAAATKAIELDPSNFRAYAYRVMAVSGRWSNSPPPVEVRDQITKDMQTAAHLMEKLKGHKEEKRLFEQAYFNWMTSPHVRPEDARPPAWPRNNT